MIELQPDGIRVYSINQSKLYRDQINWAESQYGTLWRYHLQYCDFLKQDDLTISKRTELLLNLYDWLYNGKAKPEPYPVSLRIMNVIRFIQTNDQEIKKKKELLRGIYSELSFLEKRIEYHILGNHLLENAFALLMGGTFFDHSRWKTVGTEILKEQIPEQILDDGAHFERSPTYHLIVLYRCLEAFFYLPKDSSLRELLKLTAEKMLSWMQKMSFSNGNLAHFNDSVDDQSLKSEEVINLAKHCGITDVPDLPLSESGFRKFQNRHLELLIDVAGIAPSFQPGHAHADSLSFILHVNGTPIITDPGVSTYYQDINRRSWERSTVAHNTVTLQGQNTADVWGLFRVGRRPEVNIVKESNTEYLLDLKHKLKSGDHFRHQRHFKIHDNTVEIEDVIFPEKIVEGRLHLHPGVEPHFASESEIVLNDGTKIIFYGINELSQFTYKYCKEFHKRVEAYGIEYSFQKACSFKIVASRG